MKIRDRIEFLPSAIKMGLDMGVSKRGLIKGCVRFLFKGHFRKPNELFTLGTFTLDTTIEDDE